MDIKREKICVLRESFLELTGNYKKAIILNQFVHWATVKMETDDMYRREFAIYEQANGKVNFTPSYGWIYKSSDELADDTMLGLTRGNMRKYIVELVEAGFLTERRNPNVNWDKTMQYHVNLGFIQQELNKLGYSLDGFCLVDTNELEQNTDVLKQNIERSQTEHRTQQNRTAIPKTIYNNNLNTTSSLKVEVDSKAIVNTKAIDNTKARSTTVDNTDNVLTKGSSSIGKRKDKIKYAEFVSMTQEEHDKLEEKYGPVALSEMIDKLDNYKGASGKRYKSDYRAILSWVVQSYRDEHKNAQNSFTRDNNPVAGMQGALEILSKGGGFFD